MAKHSLPTSLRPWWPAGAAAVVVAGLALLGSASCGPSQAQIALQQADAEAKAKQLEVFNQSLTTIAAQSAAAPREYHVGPEDLLEVTFYDIEDTAGEPRTVAARVSNSGFITLPYVGKVKVDGLGVLDLEEELRKEFRRFIHQPQITVFIREYRSYAVSVVGNVKTPGVLQLTGGKTLIEAIAMCGGLTVDAGQTVQLTRSRKGDVQVVLIDLNKLAETGDMRLNPRLLPGDVVNVPRAGMFYVAGMVNKPGAYPLLAPTTLSQALVTAGGLDNTLARGSGTTLYRKMMNGERKEIPVDIGDIASGKIPDPPVEAEDLIVVPQSGPKFVFQQITGLVRVGVNAVAF